MAERCHLDEAKHFVTMVVLRPGTFSHCQKMVNTITANRITQPMYKEALLQIVNYILR